jgi:hypothetical protein
MGSIPLDNGESIYIHDGTDSADVVAISLAEGNSVAKLMRNRERFDYTWADSTARTAQTGMVAGSRGYQVDTRSEYIYDNSAWRLALGYAEFTGTTGSGVPDGAFYGTNTYTLDGTRTTDSTMVTFPGSDLIRFVNPGIYSFESVFQLRNGSDTNWVAATGRSFSDLSLIVGSPIHRAYVGPGEDHIALSMPCLRITTANTDIAHYVYKINGDGGTLIKVRGRIARLG